MTRTAYEKDVLYGRKSKRACSAPANSTSSTSNIWRTKSKTWARAKRELANRVAVLLAHLLNWKHQPAERSRSWQLTIDDQRKRTALLIKATPSLKAVMADPDWREEMWLDARSPTRKETGTRVLPASAP